MRSVFSTPPRGRVHRAQAGGLCNTPPHPCLSFEAPRIRTWTLSPLGVVFKGGCCTPGMTSGAATSRAILDHEQLRRSYSQDFIKSDNGIKWMICTILSVTTHFPILNHNYRETEKFWSGEKGFINNAVPKDMCRLLLCKIGLQASTNLSPGFREAQISADWDGIIET